MFKIRYVSMRSKRNNDVRIFILILLAINVTRCSRDSDTPANPTGQTKTYTIQNTNLSNITGTLTFIENDNNSTTIDLNLDNTQEGVDNVIYLRRKTANIGGGLAAILKPLNGSTGKSSTLITKLNDGQKITYDQLLDFSGYIAIEVTDQNTGNLAAYCDIGPNELTGNKIAYTLFSPVDDAFMGLATFEERKKGTSSLRIALQEFGENSSYLANLRNSKAGYTNEILVEFPPLEGKFYGNSFSEFTESGGVVITYNEILQLNATIEVYSDTELDLVIARGGIGSNPTAFIN